MLPFLISYSPNYGAKFDDVTNRLGGVPRILRHNGVFRNPHNTRKVCLFVVLFIYLIFFFKDLSPLCTTERLAMLQNKFSNLYFIQMLHITASIMGDVYLNNEGEMWKYLPSETSVISFLGTTEFCSLLSHQLIKL